MTVRDGLRVICLAAGVYFGAGVLAEVFGPARGSGLSAAWGALSLLSFALASGRWGGTSSVKAKCDPWGADS